jgi:hypothetical protein
VSGVDELLAFVRRCLDDDERVARETLSREASPWRPYEGTYGWAVATESGGVIRDGDFDGPQVVAEHIARWDPQRVLDEVKAKRAILDEHPHEPAAPWGTTEVTSIGCATCHDRSEGVIGKGWCRTVRLLAQPFAGYDGWREEWLVSGGS